MYAREELTQIRFVSQQLAPMCRLMVYIGAPIRICDVVTKPNRSMLCQALGCLQRVEGRNTRYSHREPVRHTARSAHRACPAADKIAREVSVTERQIQWHTIQNAREGPAEAHANISSALRLIGRCWMQGLSTAMASASDGKSNPCCVGASRENFPT